MKFFLVPVLIALMFTQAFSKWLIVFEYKLNKDFISKNLCINKTKPVLKCKGKCQMMKRLAEEEKENSSTTGNTTIKLQETVFSDEVNKSVLPKLFTGSYCHIEKPRFFKLYAPPTSVFHPPAIG